MIDRSPRLFSWREMLLMSAAFAGIVVALQRLMRFIADRFVAFDCPYYWPISIFEVRRISPGDLVIAAVVGAIFYLGAKWLEGRGYALWPAIGIVTVLIAGTTLIQGVDTGFYAPIAGDARQGVLVPYSLEGQEYFHDARTITDPLDFFGRYNEIQPTLHSHAHTHPPGAVLLFYFLEKTLRDPALIAIALMLASTTLTQYFFYRLMATGASETNARYLTFLLGLLPALQIYYLATIDGLITGILIAVLYLFCFGKGKGSIAMAALLLTTAFLLTYVSLFILPVIVGFEIFVRRSVRRSVLVLGTAGLMHVVFYIATGYDAWGAFREASHYENPNGFMLFADPANYFFTRIEDVAELILFFGPFLTILFVRAIRSIKLRPLDVLTVLGCVTLMGMYAAGAWRTGETARACAYIYPFLLFPIGRYLDEKEVGPTGRLQLAAVVFAQSIGMQIIGNYHW